MSTSAVVVTGATGIGLREMSPVLARMYGADVVLEDWDGEAPLPANVRVLAFSARKDPQHPKVLDTCEVVSFAEACRDADDLYCPVCSRQRYRQPYQGAVSLCKCDQSEVGVAESRRATSDPMALATMPMASGLGLSMCALQMMAATSVLCQTAIAASFSMSIR